MTTRRLHRLLLLAAVALLLSACQLRLGVTVDVEADGAGELAVTLAADPELLAEAADAGVDPLGDVAATGRDLTDEGWTVTEERAPGQGRAVTLATSFAQPSELRALSSELAEALNAPEVELLEPFEMVISDERITVTGGAGLQPTAVVSDYGLTPAEAVALVDEEDAVAYAVRVSLPGEVLASTATRRTADGALIWTVEPGESVDVRAVGARPRLAFLEAAWAAAALAAVLLLAIWWRRRRERRTAWFR